MSLAKLNITNVDTGDTFDVLFNPTQFTVDESNTWQQQDRERGKAEAQFTGRGTRSISLELFFDTYERDEDVRLHTGKIARLMIIDINGNGARPAKVQLTWGGADPNKPVGIFPFVCYIEKLTQQFTLFTNTGMPVRAKLTVAFKEFQLPEEQLKKEPKLQSFPAQTYTIRAGDTLSGIAAGLWRDPLKWRLLADANEIRNPRLLLPGNNLIVPAID
jgi:hypothetical protein